MFLGNQPKIHVTRDDNRDATVRVHVGANTTARNRGDTNSEEEEWGRKYVPLKVVRKWLFV